jgi:hypothetical protein
MDTALETGRELFLTGLNMLANPRHVYDSGPDEIKTLLTKTIFPKLYLDADPHGHATVTDTQVAQPFTDVWRASPIPDTGPNKVPPGTEGDKCQNGAGNTARNTAMKQ